MVPVSSTPLDMLQMGVALWTFLLVCVWLGHRSMINHVGAQVVTRSRPVDPKWEFPPYIGQNLPIRDRQRMSGRSPHTWILGLALVATSYNMY